MRRILTFALGVLIGHWLPLGAAVSGPTFVDLRGAVLARLGLESPALDAARSGRGPQPAPVLDRQAAGDPRPSQAPGEEADATTVPLESRLGVWIAPVVINDAHPARFLVDTGSSVTVVSPRLAADLGIVAGDGAAVALETLAGRTVAASAIVGSLRVGGLELREAPVVLHDPGSGLDGILGNTVLDRYRVTIDADRRQLELRRLARD